MRSTRLVIGGAGAAALGVRVARTIYGHWRTLPATDRSRIEPLAEDAKERALELRGATDPEAAGRDLKAAAESLAAALIETAEEDPELEDLEVQALRDDLRRELERLATAEVKASRSTSTSQKRSG
jgi:hypothetical protein